MTFRSPYHNHDPTISEALSQEGNTSDVGIVLGAIDQWHSLLGSGLLPACSDDVGHMFDDKFFILRLAVITSPQFNRVGHVFFRPACFIKYFLERFRTIKIDFRPSL